ncbi:MAG: TIGR03560 family F420-dependent LLM class oxidoreductase [Thermoleophilia bacterium]|nr:TIGR03560 family F420-dependent LLM class oxidoreductase [Thermoleophilia bacterium]
MIEGQEGVSWEQWLALARACEDHGVETMFRSDHYLSPSAPFQRDALDAWTTIGALAASTSTLRLGTLVSPATFRHPSVLAKAAATADHVSGGRIELGLGAGWMELEHTAYGFAFPPTRERVELLAEQLEIVHGQWTQERFGFEGRHYRLADSPALPKPVQRPHPRLLVGGSGRRGTVVPAVRFADEYNTLLASPEDCRERRARLDAACEEAGRDPGSLALSLMIGCLIGRDEGELRDRARLLAERGYGPGADADALLARYRERGVAGTPEQAAERLREFEAAGVERGMLQQLLHDDLDQVALIGRELAPAIGT